MKAIDLARDSILDDAAWWAAEDDASRGRSVEANELALAEMVERSIDTLQRLRDDDYEADACSECGCMNFEGEALDRINKLLVGLDDIAGRL